ncbi:MAG: N-acetylmuramoyl-L-alanine amidase [Myxococcota bacterium]
MAISSRADAPVRSEAAVFRAAADPTKRAFLKSIVDEVRAAYPDVNVSAEDADARSENASSPTAKKTSSSLKDEPASAQARPFVVVVDPGHGGRDRGATGVGGVREKDVNLVIAQTFGEELKRRFGVRVVYTRTRDRFVSLLRRAEIANRVGADLFISVHANAHTKEKVGGLETYYWRGTRGTSMRLAQSIQASMIASVRSEHPTIRNLGTKPAGFKVLRSVRMPAVLIEVGFLTHAREARLLESRQYQHRLAVGLAKGMRDFVRYRVKTPRNARESQYHSVLMREQTSVSDVLNQGSSYEDKRIDKDS